MCFSIPWETASLASFSRKHPFFRTDIIGFEIKCILSTKVSYGPPPKRIANSNIWNQVDIRIPKMWPLVFLQINFRETQKDSDSHFLGFGQRKNLAFRSNEPYLDTWPNLFPSREDAFYFKLSAVTSKITPRKMKLHRYFLSSISVYFLFWQ